MGYCAIEPALSSVDIIYSEQLFLIGTAPMDHLASLKVMCDYAVGTTAVNLVVKVAALR